GRVRRGGRPGVRRRRLLGLPLAGSAGGQHPSPQGRVLPGMLRRRIPDLGRGGGALQVRPRDAVITGSGSPEASGKAAYLRSGVDLEAGHRAVDLIRELAGRTSRPEVVGGIGGFAGLVKLGDGRLLVASADGVGTKLEIARLARQVHTVGLDCVGLCATDVICTGAEPLFFLDYLAVGRLI